MGVAVLATAGLGAMAGAASPSKALHSITTAASAVY